MPVTRAMMNKNALTTHDSENHAPGNSAGGVKRKADGRKILGEIDGKNSSNNAKASLQARKILTTRLNNKNVAAGSELLRTKRGLGLKDVTGAASNLEKLTHTLKKGLSSMSKGSSSARAEQAILTKEKKEQIVFPETFHNHDSFCQVPLQPWRQEVKSDLSRKNVFYDYDESVKDSPNECPGFSLGIFEYMKWREQRFEMKPYLDEGHPHCQNSFHANDRRQLIDWMVEFQEIQESTHETLYLAVRLCDFYFSHKQVSRDELQLYAFIGFLLASKFEERWPPLFDDMIQLSDDQYNKQDFLRAEENMLKTLSFDINIPISYRYLRRYARCIGMDMKSMTVSRFYLELTLQEYEFVTESQSAMAAACLWIAMSTLGFDSISRTRKEPSYLKKYWSQQLCYYTGLHEWEVVPLAQRIAKVVRQTQHNFRNLPVSDDSDCEDDMFLNNDSLDNEDNPSALCKVVYKKYGSSVFFRVAQRPIIDDGSIEKHLRRCNSERIDFEAMQEPNSKRRSTGCTTKLQKMSLRSGNTPLAAGPGRGQKREDLVKTPVDDGLNSLESTRFYSAKSETNNRKIEEDKENATSL